ncbi:hypothetical protein A7K94_0208400, partial [Modestobacter sp. VKM Ac-2676]
MRDQPHAGQGSVVGSALWRGRWLIGGAAVAAGLLGAQLSALQEETYTAQSRMVLSATANFDPLGGNAPSNAGRYLANQMAILDSEPVLELVAEQLGGDADPATLAEAVSVATLADSDIVVISATRPTPSSPRPGRTRSPPPTSSTSPSGCRRWPMRRWPPWRPTPARWRTSAPSAVYGDGSPSPSRPRSRRPRPRPTRCGTARCSPSSRP